MSKKLFYLLGIVVTIIVGTFLYLHFCCNCCKPAETNGDIETPVTVSQNHNSFVLKGQGIDYHCNDNFNFLKNDLEFITPVSDSIKLGIENLKAALLANPKQKISITGYALSDEQNNTKFENLGLARANNIKNFFISQGLPETQLNTKGKIIDKWQMVNDTLLGPVEFYIESFDTVVVSADEKDKINANPLILHFNSNQSKESLSKEESQKIVDIATYSKNTPDVTVLIVGHSDSSGNYQTNIILAKKRAEFTKNYLIKKGIASSRIETQSKGSDEPVADNKTTEGRSKNRRTVITIK